MRVRHAIRMLSIIAGGIFTFLTVETWANAHRTPVTVSASQWGLLAIAALIVAGLTSDPLARGFAQAQAQRRRRLRRDADRYWASQRR